MALSEAYRLVVQTRVDDRVCSFGTSWECTSGHDHLTDTTDLTDGFIATALTPLMACLASDVSFEGLYAYCLAPNTGLPNKVAGDSRPGTFSGGSACPANMCAVITLQTDAVTAIRQGRIYLAGLSNEALLNGLWNPGFVAGDLKTFADLLKDDIVQGGKTFEPRIVQKIIAGTPVGPNLLPVVATRVTQIPYTQIRRTTKQFGHAG